MLPGSPPILIEQGSQNGSLSSQGPDKAWGVVGVKDELTDDRLDQRKNSMCKAKRPGLSSQL